MPRNSHSHLSLSLSTMSRFLTLVSLLHLAVPALTSPCVTFDANFNLLALGFGGKDYNAGTQDAWASGKLSTWHPTMQTLKDVFAMSRKSG